MGVCPSVTRTSSALVTNCSTGSALLCRLRHSRNASWSLPSQSLELAIHVCGKEKISWVVTYTNNMMITSWIFFGNLSQSIPTLTYLYVNCTHLLLFIANCKLLYYYDKVIFYQALLPWIYYWDHPWYLAGVSRYNVDFQCERFYASLCSCSLTLTCNMSSLRSEPKTRVLCILHYLIGFSKTYH